MPATRWCRAAPRCSANSRRRAPTSRTPSATTARKRTTVRKRPPQHDLDEPPLESTLEEWEEPPLLEDDEADEAADHASTEQEPDARR